MFCIWIVAVSPLSWVRFVFAACALIASVAFASEPITITESNGISLGEGIAYIEDVDGSLTFEKVRRLPDGWTISEDEVFNQGYSKSTWWLKVPLVNPHGHEDWFLEVAYGVLDYVSIYLVANGELIKSYEMGDKYYFDKRPIEHRYFVVPVSIPKSEQITIYLRVKSTSSIQVPLTLWERDSFNAADIGRTAIHGIYYGGLVIIAIYNLLIYLALGERTYLYYVGYVLAMFLFMASLNGWAFQFLWPLATSWNDTSILVSLTLVVLFGVCFTRRFLDLKKHSRFFSATSHLFIVVSFIVVGLCFVTSYSVGIRVVIILAVTACLWAPLAGVVAWLKGHQSATIYIIAWSGLIIGGIILALNKFHIIPSNLFTEYATQGGSLMEVVLLSFALAERINKERALRFKAQQDALAIQQQANEELEQRVAARTLELEEANKKLKELSDTDQLTGLKNRRYLNQYLDKEVTRAARYSHHIAVLLIDIDYFKAVNDNYGHLVGDDCLSEVAKRISSQMRWPTDLAARYGGEEFCIVLPETDLDGAKTVAERIRESVCHTKVDTREMVLDVSVSIGVCAAVPVSPDLVNEMVAKADEALYKAKDNGRNRVELAA